MCTSSRALISVPKSIIDPFRTIDVNVTGTLNLLEASKVTDKEIVNAYGNLILFEGIITLRLFNVYGDGQSIEYAGVITKFRDRIVENLSPVIFGDGHQQRDFITVEDVVDTIIIGLKPSHGVVKGTYHIATGVPTKISELARVMSLMMGKPELIPIYKENVEGDIRISYADFTNTTSILNSAPREGFPVVWKLSCQENKSIVYLEILSPTNFYSKKAVNFLNLFRTEGLWKQLILRPYTKMQGKVHQRIDH